MRSVENETRQTMNSRRNFVNYATMTLSSGDVLHLTPSDFRIAGQSFTDDLVDGDSFQIGTAIGKTATLLLDNTDGREENTFELQTSEPADWVTNYGEYYTYSGGFYYPIREEEAPEWVADTYYTLTDSKVYPYGKFSEYDFYMAYFTLDVCLPDAYHYGGELRDQMIRIGTFTVTTPTSHGATIEIAGVDNMYLFDRSFDECDLNFESGPTLLNILNKCCSDVGINLITQSFDNQNIRIYTKPEDTTYRQVVSWIAQIAGCNAVITETGDLKLKAYDMSVLNGLDGGSFIWNETEKQYQDTFTWSGTSYWLGYRITFNPTQYGDMRDDITEPGVYDVSNVKINNVVDPTKFNAQYRMQESADHGATWTTKETGTLSIGDNHINYRTNISREDNIVYRLQVGQDNTDPNTITQFDATFYIKMYSNGDVADGGYFDSGSPSYISGDNYDGGDFTTSLGFHNLTSINGTSISTDDIQFTGVSVVSETNSAHYPNVSNWDYYAMEITENPFVIDNESTIAQSVYNRISNLKFRPFATSSIQDPTIEAGDPCVIYDVKGNMYKSIITNVVFKTGGMTDLSCNAEPPAKQGARYSAPASVRKVANSMTTYQSQTAHFNEIASAALGYFRTDVADPQTGALITYLHDQPTLESSQNVVMIAGGVIAISDNYNTSQRSWNTGFDASTGTMLLNLIYVHGLTSDWIRTGELDVGGIDNEDGVIRVTNNLPLKNISTGVPIADTVDGNDVESNWLFVGPGQIGTSGTYRVFYNITDVESGKPELIKCQIQKRDKWDGTTYTFKVIIDYYIITSHNAEFPIRFEIDTTDGGKYYAIRFSRVSTINAGFTVALTYNKLNTIIDKDGIETSNLHVTGGEIAIGKDTQNNDKFKVDTNGDVIANSISVNGGTLAGMTINSVTHGIEFYGHINDILHFFKLEAWGGITSGKFDPDIGSQGSWKRLDYVQDWGLLKVDYAGHQWGGIVVTSVGSNDYAQWGIDYIHIEDIRIIREVGSKGWSTSYAMFVGTDDTSDKRAKKNIVPVTHNMLKIIFETISPIIFNYIEEIGIDGTHFGIFAQDMEEALNKIDVKDTNIVYGGKVEGDYKHLSYHDTIPIALGGIKDLYNLVDEQQAEIDDLKERIKALEDIVKTKLG